MIASRVLWTLAVAAMLSFSQNARAVNLYADPLPIRDYVDNPEEMLRRAFSHNHWTLSQQADVDGYLGDISYKGFEIRVRVVIADELLHLELLHVYATDCVSACRNLGEKPVMRWLVNLRRSIALELTYLVRDKLLQRQDR